jgi:hypothetical protein
MLVADLLRGVVAPGGGVGRGGGTSGGILGGAIELVHTGGDERLGVEAGGFIYFEGNARPAHQIGHVGFGGRRGRRRVLGGGNGGRVEREGGTVVRGGSGLGLRRGGIGVGVSREGGGLVGSSFGRGRRNGRYARSSACLAEYEVETFARLGVVRIDHEGVFEADLLFVGIFDDAAEPHPGFFVAGILLDKLGEESAGHCPVAPACRRLAFAE